MPLDRANTAPCANTCTRRRALGFVALALGVPLAGCGQKGPLYHPGSGATDNTRKNDPNKRKSQSS